MACNPKYSAQQRIVVEAKLVGNPAPSTPRADSASNVDQSALRRRRAGRRRPHGPAAATLLWMALTPRHLVRRLVPGQAPAARLVAGRALRRRCCPFFAVALYAAFENITRLLPGAY